MTDQAEAQEQQRGHSAQVIARFEEFAGACREGHKLATDYPWLKKSFPDNIKLFIEMWEAPEEALRYFVSKEQISPEEFLEHVRGKLSEGSAGAELLVRAGWLGAETEEESKV